MFRIYFLHNVFDLALDCIFQSMNISWNSTSEITLYGHQINQSHVGLKIIDMDYINGYIISDTGHDKPQFNESFHPLYSIQVKRGISPIRNKQTYLLKL